MPRFHRRPPIVLHMTPTRILDAQARGDYRRRCDTCGGLVCRKCSTCNGHHGDGGADWGRITTDKAGRTLHRDCRYDIDELGL